MQAALYGLLFGVVMFLLGDVAPQPAGSLVLWGGLALHGSWGARVLWRRTRLPFATAAVLVAVLLSLTFASASLEGYTLATPPQDLRWVVTIVGLALLSPVLLFVESKAHAAEWARWKEFMEDKTAWDILLGRHVPDLRRSFSTDRRV